jgi:hypothetical protein
MGLAGKFFGPRDMRFIKSINAELFGDVIQTEVVIFKAAASATKLNIYGEADDKVGKTYYAGIEITAMVKKEEINTEYTDFGPNRTQNVNFAFREESLKLANFFPEIGDVVGFNSRFYSIDNVIANEQLLGGVPEKSLSVICHTYLERLSSINVVERS